MTRSLYISITLMAGVLFWSCSGDKSQNNNVVAMDYSLDAFTGENALKASHSIDSMAMEADFLSTRQAVEVLMGLSEIVKAEQAKGSSGKKLEYMRKYVDTYDILSDRGQDFKDAFEEAKINYHVDFAALSTQYRDVLGNEASGASIEGEEDSGVTDATAPSATRSDSSAHAAPATPSPSPADTVH